MSKYKRRSKGHQLKRPNFGDLGLRAYKDQQETIIAALKLANQDFKTKNRDWVSSEETKLIKEQQNRNELKKLEDDVYDVKFDATKLRAKREVEALEGQADEYGRKAQFWKDFSTTYAKQYGQAAGEILGAVDKIKAVANAETYFKSPEFTQNLKLKDGLSTVVELNKQKDVLQRADKDLMKGLISKEQYREIISQHVEQKGRSRGGTTAEIIVNELLEEGHFNFIIEEHVNKAAQDSDEYDLTADNIESAVFMALYGQLGSHGIKLNSRAAKKFLDHGMRYARNRSFAMMRGERAAETNKNTKEAISGIGTALRSEEIPSKQSYIENEFYDLIRIKKEAYENVEGKGAKGVSRNWKESHIAAIEDLIKSGAIKSEDEFEVIRNLPFIGQVADEHLKEIQSKNDPTKDNWDINLKKFTDRHKETGDLFDKMWNEYHVASKKNRVTQTEGESIRKLEQAKEQVSSGKLDPANNRQMSAAIATTPHEKVKNYLSNVLVFHPNQIASSSGAGIDTSFVVTAKMNELYESKDMAAFSEIYNHYPPEIQKQHEPLMHSLLELNLNGFDSKTLKNRVKDEILTGIEVSGDNLIGASKAIIDVSLAMEQDFLNRYSIAMQDKEDKRTPTQKITDTWAVVKQRFKDGEGPYRREGNGLDVKWLAFEKESESAAMPKVTLEADLKKGEKGWDLILANVKNGKRLISQDDEDDLLNSILNNKPIPQIDNIDTIYKIRNPNNNKEHVSKTAILNEYLEARGLKQRVLPGPEDYAYYKAKNTRLIIKNWNSYSSENKMRLLFLEEIKGDEDVPISKTLDPNSPDFFQKEIDKRMNYDYWNLPIGGQK